MRVKAAGEEAGVAVAGGGEVRGPSSACGAAAELRSQVNAGRYEQT